MPDLLDRLKTALADRYAIEKELGSGGMATVYLAEDLKHHRKVAVKVLRPELAAVVGAERFLREIQIAANLNHPHILTLIDSGEAEGFLYYVMPHVQGEALSDKLRREKQLPIEDALDIARDVGSAVAYAHAQGVIHRDLKPGNILLHEGEAMVADFGLALALRAAGGERLTETGLSLGTPEYMSPEQATAEQEVDARSDIYSLGAVLYEMLVGDPPHVATSTQAIIAKLLTERPTPVRILRDTVSESVEQAVMQALAKLPADRFASAERFVDALTVSIPTGGYRQAGSSMSPKAAPVQRARRRRQVVTTVAIVLAAGSGAVAVSMMTGVDPPRSPRVVVLPLDNRTGDSTLDGLGEIVAEQLVDGLAQVRLWTGWERRADVLDVVPFGDVSQLLARLRTDAGGSRGQLGEEIADRLDADLVVSGSYTGTGQADSVRMRVEVVRVEARRTLPPPAPALAAIADPMAGVAVLQRHVMGAVAWAATGGPWAEALRSPPTYDVYEAYAEGNQAQFSGQWAEAEVGYRRAIALDPDFLPAYVTLGGGVFYNTRRWTSMDSLAEAMGRTIDPLTPVARALRDGFAATVRGNIEQMYRTRESLVDLLPFGPSWFEKGFYGLGANHLQDAVAAYKTVVDSAPDFAGKWFTWRGLVWGYHLLGDLERALDAARGSTGSAPPGQTRFLLMISHAAQGNVAETTRLVEEGRNAGVPGLFLTAALVLRRHDQPETADSLAAQLVEILNRSGSSPLLKARALMFLHRYEEAQPILEDLVRQDDGLADKGRLGVTLAGQGLTEEAGRISSELGALGDPYLFGSHTAWRARIAAVLGEQQEAVDLLREAFLQGLTVPNPENMFWLHNDPTLEALRGNEDFRKFMRPRG